MTSRYMTRALQSRDPRFARVLAKLGHELPAPDKPVRSRKARQPAPAADQAAVAAPAPEHPPAGDAPTLDLREQSGAGELADLPRQRYRRADLQAED